MNSLLWYAIIYYVIIYYCISTNLLLYILFGNLLYYIYYYIYYIYWNIYYLLLLSTIIYYLDLFGNLHQIGLLENSRLGLGWTFSAEAHPTSSHGKKTHYVYMCLPKDLNTIYIYTWYILRLKKKRSVSKKQVFGKRIGKNNLEGYQVRYIHIYDIVVSSKFASQFQKSYGFGCVLVKPYSYGPWPVMNSY